MSVEIRHQPDQHRFTTEVDGHAAYVEYEPAQDAIAITHTIVPAAIGGRGIAGELVRAAMAYARDSGLKVRPDCSYADDWMRKHPDFADLRA